MSAEPAAQPVAAATSDEDAIGKALDELKTFRHRYWAPVLLGVIMLFDSWDSIAIAFAMPSIAQEWQLDPLEMGFIISAGYGGQFIGAASLGAIAERVGRMPVFIASAAIMSILALACAFAHDYTTLFIIRLVQGITIGGAMPVAITYINELAPTKIRGRYFGLFQTLAISGFGAASLMSPLIVPHLGWRWMFGIGAIPLLLLPLVWMTLPESPRWLARIGRREAADKAFRRLGGPAVHFPDAGEATGEGAKAAPRRNIFALGSTQFRGRTWTVTMLWFLTMFTSFGLTTWAPSIYVKVYEIPVDRALAYSALASILVMLTLAITGFLIDKFGRRPFALGGLIVTAAVFLYIAGLNPRDEFTLVTLITIGKIAIFFGAFMLWPYTAETYPTEVRALALGYGSSIGRGASMLTPIFVGFVLAQGAPIAIVFGIFGLFALGAFIVWVTRTRETAGKPLETS